jgi:N-terminal EH-domain containing protein
MARQRPLQIVLFTILQVSVDARNGLFGFRWKRRILGYRGGSDFRQQEFEPNLPPDGYDTYEPYDHQHQHQILPIPQGFGDATTSTLPPPPLPPSLPGYADDTAQQDVQPATGFDDFPIPAMPDTPSHHQSPQSPSSPLSSPSTDTPDSSSSSSIDLKHFDKEYILRGLARLYRKKILPLELASRYGHFHSPPLSPADFEAPPMVLLLGQYSVGKTSFVRYLIGKDFAGMRVGPEPTTDR